MLLAIIAPLTQKVQSLDSRSEAQSDPAKLSADAGGPRLLRPPSGANLTFESRLLRARAQMSNSKAPLKS